MLSGFFIVRVDNKKELLKCFLVLIDLCKERLLLSFVTLDLVHYFLGIKIDPLYYLDFYQFFELVARVRAD